MGNWTKVESTMGENFEFDGRPSMRKIKEALGITGRRIVPIGGFGQWRQYRLIGTNYKFTVTHSS